MILASAAILVLALSVPAIGNGTNWLGLAERASDQARQAEHSAGDAKRVARRALRQARRARARANRANRRVSRLRTAFARTRVRSDEVAGAVASSAAFGDFEPLGGPSVEVTVPGSGLIEVWAQAEIADDNGGAIALYEDGQPVDRLADAEICGDESVLIDFQGAGGTGEFMTLSSPPSFDALLGCGDVGAASPVILRRPPGRHTYELRYSECSCGDVATFRNRLLRVAPRR